MDIFTKNRLAAWAIVILIAINIVAVGTLWWTQIRRPAPPPRPRDQWPRQRDVLRFLERELELTIEQVERFRVLCEQHSEQTHLIEHEIHEYRRAMTDALFEKDPNILQIETWAKEVGQKQEELELKRFQHFMDMKPLCTPEQKLRFEALLGEVLDMTRPPGPPPPAKDRRPPEKQPPPRRHDPPPPEPF